MNLLDILIYRRNHQSNTEKLFINNFLIPKINELGYKPTIDAIGNVWVETDKPKSSPFLFAAHIDTCHRGEGMLSPIVEGNIVKVNPKDLDSCCLGADDGVGIFCNLKMMEAGVGGTYVFTRGEEKGGIGASYIKDNMAQKLSKYRLCVEVDRQDFDEIIVTQGAGECASENFANQLAKQLGMGHKPSHGGVYTDCEEFAEYIPECVNIAAGYNGQHTLKETVDLAYVNTLAEKLTKVDWHSLTTHREAGEFGDFPSWQYGGYGHGPTYGQSTYQELQRYVEDNPDKIAHYMEMLGIEPYEVEKEWDDMSDWDYTEEGLQVGMR